MAIHASNYPQKAVALLLDFIAIKESGGDYDAYIGCAHPGPNDTLVSTLDIFEVYQFQRELVTSGKPSSAVGKYQFIQRTLNGCVQKLMLPLSTIFTPDIQDAFAYILLTGRDYHGWKSGQIIDAQFAHNLSCEWASLPDPYNGGKSHYDGIGPNHAGQTLDMVYAMLEAVKKIP